MMDFYGIDTAKAGRVWYWRGFFCVFTLVLFFLCLGAGPAYAADLCWVGNSGDNMNDANNWVLASDQVTNPPNPPQDGDIIRFNIMGRNGVVVNDLPGNPRLMVAVGDPDGAVNIQGNAMSVDCIDMGSAAHNLTFTCDVNLAQDCPVPVASGRTLTMGNVNSNGHDLYTGGTVDINNLSGGGDYTFSLVKPTSTTPF